MRVCDIFETHANAFSTETASARVCRKLFKRVEVRLGIFKRIPTRFLLIPRLHAFVENCSTAVRRDCMINASRRDLVKIVGCIWTRMGVKSRLNAFIK